MTRQRSPDVLGEIMGEQEGNKAIKQEGNKAIKQEGNKTSKLESNIATKKEENKAIKPPSNKENVATDADKEKATFNLSLSVLDELEAAWLRLRKQVKGKRITKTLIVETAITLALTDLEKNGKESEVFALITDASE